MTRSARNPAHCPQPRAVFDLGTENQTRFIGAPATGAYIAFAPAIDQFLKGHLFGDIFGRDNLDFQTRRNCDHCRPGLHLDGVGPQLQAHFKIGINTGITEAQMTSLIEVLAAKVGQPQADNAAEALGNKILNKEPPPTAEKMVRLANLEVHAEHLEAYKAALQEGN